MHSIRRTTTAVLSAGVLAVSLAACSGDDETAARPGGAASSSQSASPTAIVDNATLAGGNTSVALDAGFVAALTSLMVTPGAVGTGEITPAGAAVFPITGGNVTVFPPGSVDPYVTGIVAHDGSGLSLTAGGKMVELTDFVVDPGTSMLTGTVSVDGTEAAASAPLFFLDGSTLDTPRLEGGNAILDGTTVKVLPDAARLLETTFGLEAMMIPDYLTVGTATITATPAS